MFKKKIILLLICAAFFLFEPQRALSKPWQNHASEYQKLIKIYQECLSLENKIFEKLTFKLHYSQLIKRGIGPKLTLEDNLGRKWIFKPALNGMVDKPVIVYRILKLFGIACPEIHPKTLNINGKNIYGSIQRFIPNKGMLAKISPERLSQNSRNYLMNTYVFYWLLGDYDAHPSNFIILFFSSKEKIGGILRVDNDRAFNFSGRDNLMNEDNNAWIYSYYYVFFKACRSKKVTPDIKTSYRFVKFVEDFPDWVICKLMQPLITRDLQELANPDFSKLNSNTNNLLETVISRKKHLSGDFLDFYKYLVNKKKKKAIKEKGMDYKKNISQAYACLENRVNILKQEESYSLNKPAAVKQMEISAVFSLDGFKILSDIYRIYRVNKGKALSDKYGQALQQLYQLEINEANQYEKSALRLYIQEAQKISRGGKPSGHYNSINSIVNPVSPAI